MTGQAVFAFTTAELRGVLRDVGSVVVGPARDGSITFVTDACRGLLGFEPDDLVGRNIVDLLHPDDLDYILGGIDRWAGRGGSLVGPNARVRTSSGSYVECTVDAAMGDRVAPLGTMVAIME